MSVGKRVFLVTGFPGFVGRHLVGHLAARRPEAAFRLLVQQHRLDEARRLVRAMPRPRRFALLQGDVGDMHLGLSGAEYADLCDEVTDVFHLAAVHYLGVPRDLARRVNVEGTRNVLELARDCRALRRLAHFSSVFVSGDRLGVIAEDELDMGQRFRDAYEETRFQAEKLVRRALREVPAVILRPSIIVGHSRTGEIDRFDGPYQLAMLLLASPPSLALPLPGDALAPLHVVPVDFVVQAAVAIAENPAATGRTFHLVDPSPMSCRRAYAAVAEQVQRKLAVSSLSSRAAGALLKLPLVERLTRQARTGLDLANHMAFYSCQGTLELLEGTGIRCPPLSSYLPTLVDFARKAYEQRRGESAVEDPLDPQDAGAAARASLKA